MKPLAELVDTQNSHWPAIAQMIARAVRPVQVLPRVPARAEAELLQAQVSTRSPLGALVYETGGIVVDGGWVRILGGGCPQMDRGLMAWNQNKTFDATGHAGYLLVADDAIGGFFAINLGGFGPETAGHIYYFAPDTLNWEHLGNDLPTLLQFFFLGDLAQLYAHNRWPGWQHEAAQCPLDACIAFTPPLWTQEVRKSGLENATRKLGPVTERWNYQMGLAQQLKG